MRKYTDYSANGSEDLTEQEMAKVPFTKFTIVVPTDEDRIELMKAFKEFHNSDIDTNLITVNQLAHQYLGNNNIVVDPKLYDSITPPYGE